jgi:hypothetical protein
LKNAQFSEENESLKKQYDVMKQNATKMRGILMAEREILKQMNQDKHCKDLFDQLKAK